LTERGATVTLCHIDTRDVAAHCRRADILVVAVGKAGLISGRDIKPGAVVIDVGINRRSEVDKAGRSTQRIVGDVDFDTAREAAGWITPVPGGVGPVTVAMLLHNTLRAARLAHGVDHVW
jgi:methylenetetrahydrofolate dehydrogenase (NADP+)/methenyltetrahydrofolate cyclohydrolase